MELVVFGEKSQTELTEVNQRGNFSSITQFADALKCVEYFNSLANEAIMIVFSDHTACTSAKEAEKFLTIQKKDRVGVIVGNTTKMIEWGSFKHTRTLNTLSIIKAVAELVANVKKDSN